jgi:UrcA family protein
MWKETNMTLIQSLLALATLTVPALAAAGPVEQSMVVEVGDLDLNSDKDQPVIALRIQRAAKAMCKSGVLESLPQNMRQERRCIRQAGSSAEVAVQTRKGASDPAPQRGG